MDSIELLLALLIGLCFDRAQMGISLANYDAVANEVIIDQCKKRAFRWAASLCPAKELRLVSLNGSMRAYLQKDAYLTGYMLNVTIEELDGISRCNI